MIFSQIDSPNIQNGTHLANRNTIKFMMVMNEVRNKDRYQ